MGTIVARYTSGRGGRYMRGEGGGYTPLHCTCSPLDLFSQKGFLMVYSSSAFAQN